MSGNSSQAVRRFKLIIAGDGNAGKTKFIHRYLTGGYNEKYIPTLGVDVHSLLFGTSKGKIAFDVWDVAGENQYAGLGDGYFINANCAIVMFDRTSLKSYENAKKWYESIVRMCGKIPIILCGNKVDRKDIFDASRITLHRTHPFLSYFDISVKSNNYEKPLLTLSRALVCEDLYFTSRN